MTDRLRLSSHYGVNPSVDQCFFCLGDKGVILFGRLPGDVEAPTTICMDMEPCDSCAKHMEEGIILISVDPSKSKDMVNPWRTGGWAVVKEEAIQEICPPELAQNILRRRMAFVPDDAWDHLGLPRPTSSQQEPAHES